MVFGIKDLDAALIHITDKILASIDVGKVTGAAFLDLRLWTTNNCFKNCLVFVYQIIQSVGSGPI